MKTCPHGMPFLVRELWFTTSWRAKCYTYLTQCLNPPTTLTPICKQQHKSCSSHTQTFNGTNSNCANNKELSTFTSHKLWPNPQTNCTLMRYSWKKRKSSTIHLNWKKIIPKLCRRLRTRLRKSQGIKDRIGIKSWLSCRSWNWWGSRQKFMLRITCLRRLMRFMLRVLKV